MNKTMTRGLGSGRMGDAYLTKIAEHQYVNLATRGGLTIMSIALLSQQESTVGKVAFGLTTALFGFLTLAKAFEL